MSRRQLLCLQWALGLANGVDFWRWASDGDYGWAAAALIVMLVVASWRIPPARPGA
jgi:hypothetical protein